MVHSLRGQRAQTFVEYIILIGIVVAFVIAMSPILKRGVQGMVKVMADQVGRQNESDQEGGERGYMVKSDVAGRMDRDIRRRDRAGNVAYLYERDQSISSMRQYSNLGYQE